MIVNILEKSYYLDDFVKPNLDYIKDRVLNHKNMAIMIVDGRPGTGKSTLVAQYAYYITDGKFNNTFETFTLEQFSDALTNAQKGDAIVLDEAFNILNRRKALSNANMKVLSLLQQMREKQVFIFIVLPFVYDLDKNIILGLADLFIHCYRKPFGPRGQFRCYDQIQLKKLWLYCRQSYSYLDKYAKPNFKGWFRNSFPIDEPEYRKKKLESLKVLVEEDAVDNKYIEQRNKLIIELKKHIPVVKIAEILKLNKDTIYEALKKEY